MTDRRGPEFDEDFPSMTSESVPPYFHVSVVPQISYTPDDVLHIPWTTLHGAMQCNAMQQSSATSNRNPYGVCHGYLFKCCLWVIIIAFDKNSSLRVPLFPCRSTGSVFHRIACCYWNCYRFRKELTPMRSNCQLPDPWPCNAGTIACSFLSVCTSNRLALRHRAQSTF